MQNLTEAKALVVKYTKYNVSKHKNTWYTVIWLR